MGGERKINIFFIIFVGRLFGGGRFEGCGVGFGWV